MLLLLMGNLLDDDVSGAANASFVAGNPLFNTTQLGLSCNPSPSMEINK